MRAIPLVVMAAASLLAADTLRAQYDDGAERWLRSCENRKITTTTGSASCELSRCVRNRKFRSMAVITEASPSTAGTAMR